MKSPWGQHIFTVCRTTRWENINNYDRVQESILKVWYYKWANSTFGEIFSGLEMKCFKGYVTRSLYLKSWPYLKFLPLWCNYPPAFLSTVMLPLTYAIFSIMSHNLELEKFIKHCFLTPEETWLNVELWDHQDVSFAASSLPLEFNP